MPQEFATVPPFILLAPALYNDQLRPYLLSVQLSAQNTQAPGEQIESDSGQSPSSSLPRHSIRNRQEVFSDDDANLKDSSEPSFTRTSSKRAKVLTKYSYYIRITQHINLYYLVVRCCDISFHILAQTALVSQVHCYVYQFEYSNRCIEYITFDDDALSLPKS